MAEVIRIVKEQATKKDGSPLSGIGKNGKPWHMSAVEVRLDSGETAISNMFAPVAVGDKVEATYNDEYKSYNFKSLAAQSFSKDSQVDQKLNVIIAMLTEISKMVGVEPMGQLPVTQVQSVQDLVLSAAEEDKIDLSEIPF